MPRGKSAEIKALRAEVAWLTSHVEKFDAITRGYEARLAAAKEALHSAPRPRKPSEPGPVMLRLAEDTVLSLVLDYPDMTWDSKKMAERIALRMGCARQTIQNVYLPALRGTSPHAIKVGRKWLWYYNAAEGKAPA